jgi:hypothetical protein
MITDDEIRDALEHLAQHAPGPDRVLRQFAVRERARRQRRALTLVGGAVAASVAVGAPLVLLRERHNAAPGGSPSPYPDPSADPSPSPSIVNDRLPMRYRPTWLPDGMEEISRTVGSPDPDDTSAQTRAWHNAASKQNVSLQLGGPSSVDLTGLRRVAVQGGSGWVQDMAGRPSVAVIWQAAPGLFLQVFVDGIPPRSTALPVQIANSVTADGASVLELPVAFGWLPDGYRITERSVDAASNGWQARIAADDGKPIPQRSGVSVGMGAKDDMLPNGPKPGMTAPPTDVTVRGVTGTFITPNILGVPLPDGRWLRVAGQPSQADLVRVADALRIGPVPDLSWLGTR